MRLKLQGKNMKNKFNKKHLLIIGLFCFLVFFLFSYNKNKNQINTRTEYIQQLVHSYTKDKTLANYVDQNIDKFVQNSVNLEETIRETVFSVKEVKKAITVLKKKKIINKMRAERIIFEIKSCNFLQAKREIENLNFDKPDEKLLAKKEYLIGLLNEINFDYTEAIRNYEKAIEINQNNAKYYNRLAMLYYKRNNFSKAKILLEKNLGLTENNKKDSKERINTLYNLAKIYRQEYEFDKAINYYNKAYFLAKLNYNYYNKMLMWVFATEMGDISFFRGEYLEAIHFYKYSYKLSKKLWIKKIKAYSLSNLAKANYHYGDYTKGLKYSERALKFANKINDLELMSSAKYNICLNLEYLNQRDEAKIYCKDSVGDLERIIALVEAPEFLIKLGDMVSFASSIRNYSKALESYKKSYELLQQNNFIYPQVSILTKLGSAYRNTGNINEAFKYFDLSDEMNKRLGFQKFVSCNECNRAFAYMIEKKNRNAIKSYNKAIELALATGNKANLGALYANLGTVYERIEDYDKALDNFQKSINIHKQIHKSGHHYIMWSESAYEKALEKNRK